MVIVRTGPAPWIAWLPRLATAGIGSSLRAQAGREVIAIPTVVDHKDELPLFRKRLSPQRESDRQSCVVCVPESVKVLPAIGMNCQS